jgi:hypothetical protein
MCIRNWHGDSVTSGDKIKDDPATPKYMRESCILNSDIGDLIKVIKAAFKDHYQEYKTKKMEAANRKSKEQLFALEVELRKKLHIINPKFIQHLEQDIGAAR